jgi:hypothetical protein
VPLTSTLALGSQKLRVVVDDGISPVTLYPHPEIATAPITSLTTSSSSVSTLAGGDFDLTLDGGPGLAGRPYLVLASASGSTPSTPAGLVNIPLVDDLAFAWSYALCNSAILTDSCGQLDANGRATTGLHFPPMFLRNLLLGELTFAYISLDPIDFASNTVVVDVVP